jgi:Haemolysin XhlA
LEPVEKLEERMVKIEERQANIETRVALAESHIKDIKGDLGAIKDDTKWIIKLIIGSVLLAILGTVLVKTGVL